MLLANSIKRAIRRVRYAAGSIGAPTFSLMPASKPNTRYEIFREKREITLGKQPHFSASDTFFAMGSCFAEEIRKALVARGISCVPRYKNINIDSEAVSAPELPSDHLSYYNTFSVRLQIEQALGLWRQPEDDFWVPRKSPDFKPAWKGQTYQDPYKRVIRASSPDALSRVISDIDRETASGFDAATAFIFTFGMTEVFRNKRTGKVVCQKPAYGGGGGSTETELHVSSFEENLENVLAIVDMIRERKPGVPIVVSVSPVPLARTFQDMDILAANVEGKSVLCAVLGRVSRERTSVFYLPSYELVGALGYMEAYRKDWRHIERETVDRIVGAFFEAYFTTQDGER